MNAFSYGVFTLMLPLRAVGDGPLGSKLCVRNRFHLLSFHDRDHGDGSTPLLPWIETLLRAEGIADADGEIWLQTFPRVSRSPIAASSAAARCARSCAR